MSDVDDDTRTSWRIRDAATGLPAPRNAGLSKKDENLTLSSSFDVETCLARIRRDKASVVRSSFEAAACCVLEAINKLEDEVELESIDEDDLPKELDDFPALEQIRSSSMRRSYDNKDPSKRKASDGNMVERPIRGKTTKKTDAATPKFTRNTPASSAAALDTRLTGSRAILCAAASVAFDLLTPSLPGLEVDVSDIPQNPATAPEGVKSTVSNMGAVVVEAETLGRRIASVATNAARRSERRFQYRKDNIRYAKSPSSVLQVENPFAWKDDDDDDTDSISLEHVCDPQEGSLTQAWEETCLPRLLSILKTGAGHALYHDAEWGTRHGRIANLLQEMALKDDNFGPHLIITVEPDVNLFLREFRSVDSHLRLTKQVETELLRALEYSGSSKKKKYLRKKFKDATGMAESSFHVIITSYTDFIKDYLHFCQMTFESVVVDDGASLMATAQADLNSQVGTLWESAFFSKSDQHMGLAGSMPREWDFGAEKIDKETAKDAWIGLTTRHRILTTCFCNPTGRFADSLPISGLVNFAFPHFADSVREEWDRSRITSDSLSMKHFQKLLTRSVVVHTPESETTEMFELALECLNGKVSVQEYTTMPVPRVIQDDDFVNEGKISQSRKAALHWLGKETWLRYEIGISDLQPIVDVLRISSTFGHMCEELVVASATTTTGATGQVAGTLAYRLALRCGRHFGSEQGLRQHLAAHHAPPGTWLCRTCGSDCITSQARTQHERSCGQPSSVIENEGPSEPTSLGKNTKTGKSSRQHGPAGVVGKKKGTKTPQPTLEEKDAEGAIRVSSYRGVWVNQSGKYFIKIGGETIKDGAHGVQMFASVEEAARKHDEVLRGGNPTGNAEFNFKPDGSRIVYEDVSTSSTTGIGGGAASVVPALSVINIKDLPPDVKPLLRDPRQTSRTGGNSKRHVYAYRGVCRQARKGHDRWQSQISFMGVNHYLGTFDSEWDAAAIYAWAHLILYGEEATKQAQKEGEEAAAAYEKEKREIAAGVAPTAAPKTELKAKKKNGRKAAHKEEVDKEEPLKKKRFTKNESGPEKKRPKSIIDKESLAPILAKSTGRAQVLAPRPRFADLSDIELASGMSIRLMAARQLSYAVTDVLLPAPQQSNFCPCAPVSTLTTPATGGAMLLGLSPSLFGWAVETCLASRYFDSEDDSQKAEAALTLQFGVNGDNEAFKTLIRGSTSVLGCASFRMQRAYSALNLGAPPVGGAVGSIDCHIGGNPKYCTESAALIRHVRTSMGGFQFSALCADDVVTLNGSRVKPEMGSFPLFNEDICTVGPRVFVFLLPSDT